MASPQISSARPTFLQSDRALARAAQGESAAVATLNAEGAKGWEAVGMTALGDGTFAVLLKRSVVADPLRVHEP